MFDLSSSLFTLFIHIKSIPINGYLLSHRLRFTVHGVHRSGTSIKCKLNNYINIRRQGFTERQGIEHSEYYISKWETNLTVATSQSPYSPRRTVLPRKRFARTNREPGTPNSSLHIDVRAADSNTITFQCLSANRIDVCLN